MKTIHYPYMRLNLYRIILIKAFIIFSLSRAGAQEQFRLTNYIYSIHAINPAFTGIEDAVNLNMGFRRQWAAVEGAPMTYYAGINGSLSAFKDAKPARKTLRKSIPRLYGKMKVQPGTLHHGVGMYVSGDSYGPFKDLSAFLTYSLMIQISQKYAVSLGISTEYANQRFIADKISLYNPDLDQVYQNYAGSPANISRLNMNAGVMIYGKDLYFGYSIHQLASLRLSRENFTESGDPGFFHFLTAGYNIFLSRQLTFQPSALVKYNESFNWQADVVSKLKYRELLWTGVSWSYENSIGFLFGLQLGGSLYLGYSYEFNTGDIGQYSQGTHELALGYRLFGDRISTPFLW